MRRVAAQVEEEVFKTRLLHLKGSHRIRAKQVEPACASLNSGDVFLLDTGAILYQVTVTATQPPPATGRCAAAAAPAWLLSG